MVQNLYYTSHCKKNITVIRTQNDPYVQNCLGIPLERAPWISYGSDTLLFHPDKQQKQQLRSKYEIPEDAFVVIYAGKLDETKGGKLLAVAFQKKYPISREVVLVVVGNSSGDYGKGVEEIFARSENRIIRFPTQKYLDLPGYYQMADICVFATQCSLSFYDVQACGLPVVSEDNNVNLERCSHRNGLNFLQGSVDDLRGKILSFARMPDKEFLEYSENSLQFILDNYDYEKKAREYECIIKNALRGEEK